MDERVSVYFCLVNGCLWVDRNEYTIDNISVWIYFWHSDMYKV